MKINFMPAKIYFNINCQPKKHTSFGNKNNCGCYNYDYAAVINEELNTKIDKLNNIAEEIDMPTHTYYRNLSKLYHKHADKIDKILLECNDNGDDFLEKHAY